MARRKAAPKRKPLPDPKYKNTKVAKFMNQIMLDGKKSIAEGILYGAFIFYLNACLGAYRSISEVLFNLSLIHI